MKQRAKVRRDNQIKISYEHRVYESVDNRSLVLGYTSKIYEKQSFVNKVLTTSWQLVLEILAL